LEFEPGTLRAVFDAALALGMAVTAVNGLIHGYTGFGGALLTVPLLTFLFGPVEAIAIVSLMTIFGSAQLYPRAARNALWRELLPIFAGIAAFMPLGAYFLFSLDPQLIRRAMGGFILVFAFVLMSGWVYRGPRGIGPGAVVGALAGGITGASGVGGPPLALYYLASAEPVDVQRANIIISVAVLTLAMLTTVAVGGGFSEMVLLRAVLLAPAYVAGVWAGAKLFSVAPKSYFRRMALWLLIVTGVSVLIF